MKLVISETVLELFPQTTLGVVRLHHGDNAGDSPEIVELLRQAESALPEKFGGKSVIDHPHIAVWREAYRRFGARPKDAPSSVENLARRVLGGTALRHVNNLVSLYNAVSLRYLLPVGGEDLDKVSGDVLLTRAGNDELPVCLLGEQEARPPHPGEVIYKDAEGTLCRRWNWKEADRTKLTRETKNAFLVIETLPPVPFDVLRRAVEDLADLVRRHGGGEVSTAFLDGEHPEVDLL